KLFGAYHQFSDDDGSIDYGDEWDIGIAKSFATNFGPITLSVQYADYEADNFSTDINKLWLTVGYKLKVK
ncbi:MAG: hypothetical protein HOF27_16175, partial [Rhodospirillaceae bacterium]|nr:hypothetical protein [Rhodospirillaceae bacterium]